MSGTDAPAAEDRPRPADDEAEARRRQRRKVIRGIVDKAAPLSLAPRAKAPVVVVTLCKDRPAVVASFVTQQLALGATELRVYFDDPEDRTIPWAEAQPGVIVTACDAEFWRAVSWQGRPDRPVHIEARQSAISTHAYATVPEGHWVGFCDIDELFVPHEDFPAFLAAVPPETEQIHVEVAEAIWMPGAPAQRLKSATLARRQIRDKDALEPVARRRTALFRTFSNKGLIGHVSGKALVRSGLGALDLRIHSHRRLLPDGTPQPLQTLRHGPMTLLHFDALSYDIWVAKHSRRLARETAIGGNPPHRSAQSELFGLCTDEDGRRALFQQFYGTSPEYLKALQKAGALMRIDPAPRPEG